MALGAITEYTPGFVDTMPVVIQIQTTDTYATVTTAGYLNPAVKLGTVFSNNQMALVNTTDDGPVWLQVSVSGGNVSLVQPVGPGDVTLPTIANHLIVSTNTSGALANLTGTAINNGSLQAGLSGTAGSLISFPSTASKGSLRLTAVANTGDTITTISNAAMGQASVISIPDPAAATADFLIAPAALVNGNLISASGTAGLAADSGVAVTNVQLKSGIKAVQATGLGGSGAGPLTITQAACTSSSIIVCQVVTSSNPCYVEAITAGSGSFTVTMSADPGATLTLNYILYVAAQ